MKLPIASESYQPSADTLVRAVRRSEIVLARVCAEETILDGVTAYTHSDRVGVRCANFAAELQQVGDLDPVDVLNALFDHFAAQGTTCLTLAAADAKWPDGFAAPIEERGFKPRTRHVYRMGSYQPPKRINETLQIVPARSLYGELKPFYESMARREHGADDALAKAYAATMIDRLDEPRLELFIARLEGKPVAVAGTCSLGDTGVIVPAWSDPDHRGQGIAGTLMAHVLDLCKRAQFEQVIIDRSEGCTSVGFYQSLGFAVIAQYVKYYRSNP